MVDADEPEKHTYIEVANAALYHELRGALAAGEFEVTAISRWPVADLTNERRTVVARAVIRPGKQGMSITQELLALWEARVADHLSQLGDLTADCLDVVTHAWIKQASAPHDLATITTADFLRLRGIKAHLGASGKRSGFSKARKREVARQLALLDALWISCFSMPSLEWEGREQTWKGETKALVIHSLAGPVADDGEFDTIEVWRVAPGEVFAAYLLGPGRQTAMLSQKALNYNPLTHWPEKRLARYFAYQTRLRQRFGNYCGPFRVRTLLRAIRMPVDDFKPSKTRARLEAALQRIQENGVINEWRYLPDDVDDSIVHERYWALKWQEWRIEVAPPDEVTDQYFQIKAPDRARSNELVSREGQVDSVAAEFKQERKRRALTLQVAAEQLGVHWNYLAISERGARPLSPQLRERMIAWLRDQPEEPER